MFISGVNNTSDKIEKFEVYIFSYFVKSLNECTLHLKVPKRENFLLAFFAQTKPIRVCDLEIKKKKKLAFDP